MIKVKLPDGRSVSVDTDDPEEAAKAAHAFAAGSQDGWTPPEREPVGTPRNLEGMSNYDKFALGATKSVVDIGRGLKQIGMEAGNAVGLVDDSTVDTYRQYIDAIQRQDAPILESGAGLAGNITGTLATTLLPAGLIGTGAKAAGLTNTARAASAFINPTTLASATTVGGIQGAIQPVGTEQSRTQNTAVAALTGAASNAVLKGAAKIAQPVKNQLGKIEKWAVGVLEKAGVPLDLAQKTGSGLATRASAYLDDSPVAVAAQQEFRRSQQSAFNKAVLSLIGEDADAATPEVLDRAASRMGAVFDDFANRNPIKVDGLLKKRLEMIERNARKELPANELQPIMSQIDDILEKSGAGGTVGFGSITGKAYQNIRTSLDRLSIGTNQNIGHFARELRGSLDEAMQRYASAADKTAIGAARQGWRRLKQIEAAVIRNEMDDIVPTRLYNALSTKANSSQVLRGRGDQELVNLAKAGKVILKSKTPNSGTAARIAAQLSPGAIVGGVTLAAGGDWQDAAKLGAATYVAPKIVQQAMNNPQISSALANGLPEGALRQLLNSPQGSALLGGVLRQTPVIAAPVLTK